MVQSNRTSGANRKMVPSLNEMSALTPAESDTRSLRQLYRGFNDSMP